MHQEQQNIPGGKQQQVTSTDRAPLWKTIPRINKATVRVGKPNWQPPPRGHKGNSNENNPD